MARKAVVVLGGGVGGLVAANLLHDKLGDLVDITLIERKKVFEFPPSYPWVMLGQRRSEQAQRPLSSLSRKGIRVVTGEVSNIDLKKRKTAITRASPEPTPNGAGPVEPKNEETTRLQMLSPRTAI